MTDPISLLILFGVGLLAGVINVMAGGGSTLTLPTLIFVGLDAATANGTNRIAITLQNIFATASFHRERLSGFRNGLLFGLWTVPGAIIGAIVAVEISDEWFRRILGIIMILVVISMIVPQPKRADTTDEGRSFWLIYPTLFCIGFYGGFIQVGIGFLFMAAFYHLLRMNLVFVNLHKVVAVLVYSIPALAVFVLTDHVNWSFGLSLGAGNALGGWWSARWSVRRGETIIRYVLIVAVLIMAGKILELY
jgi:uncharacterized membrane protein YfcA